MCVGGNRPPPDVDQLKLREMTSDFAEEASEGSEGESATSSVKKLAESLSATVETFNTASQRKRPKKRSGPKNLAREISGRAHRRDRMRRTTASRDRNQRKQEGPF